MREEPRARASADRADADLRPHPRASTPATRVLRGLPREEAVARLAAGQGGRVSARQLGVLGLDGSAVHRRRASGRLCPTRRGVYAVGHAGPVPDAELWDAILTLGPDAVLRGRTAAAVWALLPAPLDVEVLLPGRRADRPGLRVHGSTWLPPAHVRVVRGLPVTSIPRTLLDLAGQATYREVERAYDAAEVAGRLNRAAVEAVAVAAGPRRGTGLLRAVLDRDARRSTLTDSELEERLLERIRAAGLPEPETQVEILRYRVDFCWRAQRVVAEADGLGTHGRRDALRTDRRRLNDLTNAGWTVVAFVWDDVVDDPGYVVGVLATALARAGGA